MNHVSQSPLMSPFTVVVDTREQMPYEFAAIHADAAQHRRLIHVPREVRCLSSGDYSIAGEFESRVAVERKSLADLFSTLGQGRKRFTAELERLAAYDFAAVVVEATWEMVLGDPPPRSELNPKTIYRSVIAWQVRYPRVHWWMCPNRAFAEVTTYRILERFWKERENKKGEK